MFKHSYLLGLLIAGAAHADLILAPALGGQTLLIRQRSFTAGAPAGWTNVAFTGTPGAPTLNAQPGAVQAALRLVDVDSNAIFPVEPRLAPRGPVDVWTRDAARLAADRADLKASATNTDADLKSSDAEVRRVQADMDLLRARVEALAQTTRIVEREVRRDESNADARAQLDELKRDQTKLSTALYRAEHVRHALVDRRAATVRAAEDDRKARERRLDDESSKLAGFYVAESRLIHAACARPWRFEALPGQDVNPFYPGSGLATSLGGARLWVCVSDGRLHATYLLDAEDHVIATALYGRSSTGQLNRIVIRAANGQLIEDHQFLPGPNQTVRYGLTFRDANGGLTSVYTDLATQ